MPHVRDGVDKQDLLENHGHVLGLRDINLTVAAGSIRWSWDSAAAAKSTLVRHVNRSSIPPKAR